MYHKVIEVIKARKKEVKAATAWLAEESDISEQTVKRMLSPESSDALFGNVCKVSNLLGLSLGDLDPKAAEDFDGKLVKDFLIDHKKLSEDYSNLKAENDHLKEENVRLEGENDDLKAELAELRLTLNHKEEIMQLQDEIIRLHKAYGLVNKDLKF